LAGGSGSIKIYLNDLTGHGAFSFARGQAAAAAFAATSVSRVNHIDCPLLWSGVLEAMQSGCSKPVC
jgi:hypothetical protein